MSVIADYTNVPGVAVADWPSTRHTPTVDLHANLAVSGTITENGTPVAASTLPHRVVAGGTPETGSLAVSGQVLAGGGAALGDTVVTGSLHVAAFAAVSTLAGALGTGAVGSHLTAGAHTYKVCPLGPSGAAGPVSNAVVVTVPTPSGQVTKLPVVLTWSLPAGHMEPATYGWAVFVDNNLLTTALLFDERAVHTFTDDGSLTPNAAVHPPAANTTGGLAVDGALSVGGAPVVIGGATATETITPDHTAVLVINGVSMKVPVVLL